MLNESVNDGRARETGLTLKSETRVIPQLVALPECVTEGGEVVLPTF